MAKEYNTNIQRLFLEMMLEDPQSYIRVQNIFNAENFDRSLQPVAEFIYNHSSEFKTMPTAKQIEAVTNVELKPVPDLTEEHYDWFLDEFEGFTRQKELERAILQAADMLENGDYDPVERLIKDAVQISLTKDMGTDYFADPKGRLKSLKDGNGQVSTGWPIMDQKLYGGFNRGELNIFAGGSGSGKSLVMQNIAVNWITAGLNGVYITMELSEDLCGMRIDSMITDIAANKIFKELDEVELRVGIASKKSGKLHIKYMPAGSNVNDMRAYLKELQIKTGKKIDFICMDYLDLASPAGVKVNPSDQFIKDKYVSEELRNLAKELNVLFVTASQLNRSSVEEVEFDHSHIAGGISKINTADNVFGIFTSRAMREHGRYQLQLMKTRSSSGVGSKVDLAFNIDTLRISDLGEDEQDSNGAHRNNSLDSASVSNTPAGAMPQPQPTINAEVNSSKLKQMLAGLKSDANG